MGGTSSFMKKFSIVEFSIVSLFWILLFASPLLPGLLKEGIDWLQVIKVWKERSVLLSLFFVNRFILLPFLLFRHRRVMYILTVSLLIGTAVTGMYISTKKPAPGTERKPPQTEGNYIRKERNPKRAAPPRFEAGSRPPDSSRTEPIPAYINMLIFSVLIFGFDTGLKTASKWVYSEQQRLLLEKENVETQLAFLKHQINPHFFMNTLNNIHSLIDINAIEAKKSVIKLSNLMRHLLYESNEEQSPLKNEVEFIRSYVELMKLRYSKDVRITLSIPDEIPDRSIPPLLFISLLENAFKHGISYMKESFVQIELSFESNRMHLTIINSKNTEKAKDPLAGIGIENTRKRLDLLYKENYSLYITDREKIFITNLIIPL
ncbi:MAG TPA: histidine kinase [Bacteroidales bacterium]|nr:histidine kinase [Bacteroidales bacterium]